jgi:hypothetical protein
MPKHFPIARAWKCAAALASLALLACSCTTVPPTTNTSPALADTQPSTQGRFTHVHSTTQRSPKPPSTQEPAPPNWDQIAEIVGVRGVLHNTVYQITVPRKDLKITVIGEPVPTEAGMASVFYLYHCTCGKTIVYGEFCLPDYEVPDVTGVLIDGEMQVTGISNLLIGTYHYHMLGVHFYYEGDPLDIAKTLKAALNCTGEAREVKQPLK